MVFGVFFLAVARAEAVVLLPSRMEVERVLGVGFFLWGPFAGPDWLGGDLFSLF